MPDISVTGANGFNGFRITDLASGPFTISGDISFDDSFFVPSHPDTSEFGLHIVSHQIEINSGLVPTIDLIAVESNTVTLSIGNLTVPGTATVERSFTLLSPAWTEAGNFNSFKIKSLPKKPFVSMDAKFRTNDYTVDNMQKLKNSMVRALKANWSN